MDKETAAFLFFFCRRLSGKECEADATIEDFNTQYFLSQERMLDDFCLMNG